MFIIVLNFTSDLFTLQLDFGLMYVSLLQNENGILLFAAYFILADFTLSHFIQFCDPNFKNVV